MRNAAAIPCVALILGSAFGVFLPAPPTLPAVIALTACAVSAFWCWRGGGARLLIAFVAGAFFSGAVLLSAVAWQRAWRPPLRLAFEAAARAERERATAEGRVVPMDDEAMLTLEGTLRSDAAPGDNGVFVALDVESASPFPAPPPSVPAPPAAPAGARVALTVVGALAADHAGDWRAGRRVRLPAQLRRAARYLDPGVSDFERALARRGTTLVGTVKSGALVDVVGRGGWWSEALASARAFSRRAIAGHVGVWSPQSAAIVSAIVIGDRSALDPAIERRLQEAGTYHVIAISGGNIAILAGLLVGAFRVAGVLGRMAMIAAIGVLIAYAQFVGGGASVDRATLMAVVYFAARALDLKTPPLNALAVVGAVLVASNPLSIADPAFLLTFGATLAILTIVPVVDWRGRPRWLAAAGAMFLSSVAAELLLLPVAAVLFERVTFAGLLLNFLAIPLMAVAQIAGMSVIPAAAVAPKLAGVAGLAAHAGAHGLIWSADLVRFVPFLTWRVAAPALCVCIIYYTALAGLWFAWRLRFGFAAIALVAGLWMVVDPRSLVAARGDGRLHVTFFDVGQGDAALVVFPRGSTLLVDAGGLGVASSFDIGDRVLGPAIRATGLRRLDRVALTHGDADHIGGALSIVNEFRPLEVWEGIPVPRAEPLAALRTATLARSAAWANVYAPYRLTIDGVELIAWHPNLEEWERQKVRNDDSLVLELRWGDASIVLTGDIGREVEQTLTSRIQPARIRVVKIPHHGSLTSSSEPFVRGLAPQVAVVSAGRMNRFGHPAPAVLRRYEAVGATVFRTDRDGAVFVETDGRSLTARAFASASRSFERR